LGGRGVGTSGKGEVSERGIGGWIHCTKCVHMYINTKVISGETVPGIRGRRIKVSSGGDDSSIIYSIHCKKLCKCHNVPLPRK
jgi:hypothetical protein